MSKSVWIIAGESSGDLYGARLARELCRQAPDLAVRGMGGQAMREAGVDILVDSSALGVVGFVEVFRHLGTFLAVFRGLVRRAIAERPAAVVLIDYPGFNLRFAKRLHAAGIPVIYYISPQVWAWGKRRIPHLARVVRKMLVIFPFETATYARTGLDVEFVGHPLIDILAEKRDPRLRREPATLVLLPGSRDGEVDTLLPVMARTASWLSTRHPEMQVVLPAASTRIADRCRSVLARVAPKALPEIRIVTAETHLWLQRGTVGLAASGTVTMECAILGLPLVVAYRVNPITYWLGRLLVRLPFFTIVNLVTGWRVFEEFLQGDVAPQVLGPALEAILPGGTRRADVEDGMAEAVGKLGERSNTSQRAAAAVLRIVAETP